jgi:hypothetical protein
MARLRALFGTGALVCIVLGGGAVPAAAQQGSRNIVDYIRQPGDQVIDVPDGTYRGGDVSAPHDATDGPYNGWLVLRAETKGGVVVDLADAE